MQLVCADIKFNYGYTLGQTKSYRLFKLIGMALTEGDVIHVD